MAGAAPVEGGGGRLLWPGKVVKRSTFRITARSNSRLVIFFDINCGESMPAVCLPLAWKGGQTVEASQG